MRQPLTFGYNETKLDYAIPEEENMAKAKAKAKKKEPVKYHGHIDLLVTGAAINPNVQNVLEVEIEADIDKAGKLTNIKLGDGTFRRV